MMLGLVYGFLEQLVKGRRARAMTVAAINKILVFVNLFSIILPFVN